MLKYLYIVIGTLSLSLGVIGIFVPLLPTTPFLLLAAALYFRSSPVLYERLLNHRYLGTYIRNFREYRAIPLRAKVISITLLWATLSYCAFGIAESTWLRLLFGAIAIGVTWHILSYKTLKGKDKSDKKDGDALIERLSMANIEQAWRIIRAGGFFEAWASIGAETHVVGSLRMGLLVKHRDIDLHIYSSELSVPDSFRAVSLLARNTAVKHIEYANLADTEERCIEWHLGYVDDRGEMWQIDMIHILRGSRYDGYFERVADRISAVLTPEMRRAILSLKYTTPDTMHIAGVEYYRAVIAGGVRSYEDFLDWREKNPVTGIIEWLP